MTDKDPNLQYLVALAFEPVSASEVSAQQVESWDALVAG
jgi:hypothetical protein